MNKLKLLIKQLQDNGLPIFFLRDPVTKKPSVSLTMLILSFNLCLFGVLNKAAKLVDGLDIENSLELFLICAGLYFGRSLGRMTETKKEGE